MKQTPRITFADWIKAYGVRRLARALGVDPSAVSSWRAGKTQPNLDHATLILAAAKGKLRAADLKKGGIR